MNMSYMCRQAGHAATSQFLRFGYHTDEGEIQALVGVMGDGVDGGWWAGGNASMVNGVRQQLQPATSSTVAYSINIRQCP